MEIMGDVERPMMEYSFPTADGTISSIAKPAVQANNFEIKPTIIQIIRSSVQFSGLPDEDPNKHLANFLEICDTFRFNGVSDDAVRLRFFHSHYVILLKTGFSLCLLVQTFYNGVTLANRATIDAAAGGTIMKKLPSEAFNIIDEITTNLYSCGQERTDKRTTSIHSIEAIFSTVRSNDHSHANIEQPWGCNVEWFTNRTLWCMQSNGTLESRLQVTPTFHGVTINNKDHRISSTTTARPTRAEEPSRRDAF
ncbi:UNVERIFIED_CONTAM: hypothetical protein Slati_0822500 [Sesamum latifolium]|uniref:Uncharacterized protein n=1 Tax=Sesamum latifolium TaxID=2727402 RepID=A0AAW2XLY0_9LAMI